MRFVNMYMYNICVYYVFECMYLYILVIFSIVFNLLLFFSLEGLAAGLVLLSRGVHPQPQPV